MMGSFLCLPARGAFVTSTSLLCFHSSFHDKCTGNGGPGANENCATTGKTRSRANFLLGKIPHGTVSLSTKRDTLTSFDSDCCACGSCCRAGPRSLSRAALGGISERILTIFFMSTHKDQWFCAKRYLILGS